MTDKKAQTRSITDRLRTRAKDEGVAYENVLTESLIERLLIRLLREKSFSKQMVFKGGYVSLRVYSSPRFTVDLDATLTKGKLSSLSPKAVVAVESDLGDGVWFKHEKSVDLETQGEYGGLRLVFRTGLGEILKDFKKGQIVNFDMGVGDPITPGPRSFEMPSLLGNESIVWPVYPVETTAAEKLHCLITRSLDNSRSKDVFDLSILLPVCDGKVLKKALEATFSFRGSELPSNITLHLKTIDTTTLQRGWNSAVADIQPRPKFEDTFSTVAILIKGLLT